jgi:thioredoxin 1
MSITYKNKLTTMIKTYVTEVNSENFEEKISEKEKSLIYIKASWCGPCKQLSPTIDEVSSDLGSSVTVAKMDADENMDLLKSMNIRNIPTLLYYKNGELKERTVGAKTKNEIIQMIESL